MAEVFEVLDAAETLGSPVWVAGGWGVDVLVGRQTREHRDLDLALDARFEDLLVGRLETLGYRVETDQRPARVELAAPGRRWVDLHPVVFDDAGEGRQADLHGGFFVYPREAFASGHLAGRRIPCLSARQQRIFRRGYPLRPVDYLDLAELERLVG
ncbi:nucleotidyltransferase domain-containing protein [Kineosporia babensis]|uniref:Amino acid transporter n=1 Tax=Kineosporia babensis TaxID=499548 RepID=A0A9X1NNR9_9ACTN|nr:hypothetical protein [Kineosporia babensis]MCD5316458.1 hypothetical protein [Kineosporia babensis]